MAKMVGMPICDQTTLKFYQEPYSRWPPDVGPNDDPRLTLTYLTSRSNLLPKTFKWEKFWKDKRPIMVYSYIFLFN